MQHDYRTKDNAINAYYIDPKYPPMALDECTRKYLQKVYDSISQHTMAYIRDSDSDS